MTIPYADSQLVFTPLGGVGVIGMNAMLLGHGEDLVLLDCGVLFADQHQPGVDLVLPCMTTLDRVAGRLRAIVLTHGHEDHIGAVPFIAERYDLPVYGTRFTLELIRSKAKLRGARDLNLHEIAPGQRLTIGQLSFEPLRVTHSLPDCVSLAIRSPVGNVLFTGDWKRDEGLPCGTEFDIEGFRAFGDEGVLAMMSDSTNAEVPGHTRSEAEVAVGLAAAIADCKGRVMIGLFSSNLYRIHAVLQAARANGRKVALAGRSLFRYLDACRAWGGLDLAHDDFVDMRRIDRYEDHEIILVCTGSQGEPRAALGRIANGTHPKITARAGDTLILSSRKIPGNEKAIFALVDGFARRGVEIIHRSDKYQIHASGHAASDELRWLLEAVRPRFFMPVHGVYTFLQRHAEIAREVGAAVPMLMCNGDVVALDDDGPRKIGEVEPELWMLDGHQVGNAATLGINHRVEMSHAGAVAVSTVFGKGPVSVRVSVRGLFTDEDRLVHELEAELGPWLTRFVATGVSDESTENELAAYTRRFFRRALDRRPLVVAHLHRVGK